ncbi:MAG: choice-of-anchor tandem repeat NxxGxxAF-containing protein [Planctomycetota bacterium]
MVRCGVLAVAIVWCASVGLAQGVSVREVARADSRVQGVPRDAVFRSFGPPRINDAGRVVFSFVLESGDGVTASDDQGLLMTRGRGRLTVLVREGGDVDGASGRTIASVGQPVINSRGLVAFAGTAREAGGAVVPAVFRSDARGRFEAVARMGGRLGGLPEGVEFSGPIGLARQTPLDDQSNLAIKARLVDPGGRGTNRFTEAHFVVDTRGELTFIAREGESVHGAVDGVYRKVNEFRQGSSGALVYTAAVREEARADASTVVYTGSPRRGVVPVFTVREEVPGLGEGVSITASSLFDLNERGALAFRAQVRGPGITHNDWAIVTTRNGSAGDGPALEIVVQEGDQAFGLDEGVVYDAVTSVDIDAARRVMFAAHLRGPGVTQANQHALFVREADGSGALLARAGDPAPGLDGPVIQEFFGDPMFNDAGQTLFVAQLDERGTKSTFARACYVASLDGRVQLVAAENRPVPSAPGRSRSGEPVVAHLTGFDLNDRGEVAFGAEFEDGDQAVLVATVRRLASE